MSSHWKPFESSCRKICKRDRKPSVYISSALQDDASHLLPSARHVVPEGGEKGFAGRTIAFCSPAARSPTTTRRRHTSTWPRKICLQLSRRFYSLYFTEFYLLRDISPLRCHTSPRSGLSICWQRCKLQSQFVRRVSRRRGAAGRRWRRWRRHEFVTLTQIVVLGGGPAGRVAGCQDTRSWTSARDRRAKIRFLHHSYSRPETGFQPASQPARVSHKRDRRGFSRFVKG